MTELFVIVKYKNMMLDLNLSQFGREKIWGYVNGKDWSKQNLNQNEIASEPVFFRNIMVLSSLQCDWMYTGNKLCPSGVHVGTSTV